MGEITGRLPDISLRGKLKTLKTVPHPDNPEEVVFSLVFQTDEEAESGEGMLEVGCKVLDAEASFVLMGQGTGFDGKLRAGCVQKVSATVNDEAGLRVAFTIQTNAGLEEMYRLWELYLPQVGQPLLVFGHLRQGSLFPEATVTVKGAA